MHRKYGVILLLLGFLFTISCMKFHVTREIKNNSAISKLKNTGIVFRVSHNSPVPLKLLNNNLSQWMEPYKKLKNLKIITGTSRELHSSTSEFNRFLQFSSENDFQINQSLGIISHYLEKNKAELDKIMADNGLDSLMIVEVDCSISAELQFSDFSSMVVIINSKYQVLYLDRQFDTYEAYEIDRQILQEDLLDRISNRLLQFLKKYDFVKES
jgi:hypothetical protein